MGIRVVLVAFVLGFSDASIASDGPLTLQAALEEAQSRNPELIALRAQLESERLKPGQERFLMPPMLEAQIWQWPVNRVSPAGATYMITAQQQFPGRGKREQRVRLAEAEVAVSAASIPVRARDILADVKRTYAELFVARKAIDISRDMLDLLRQIADATQVRYAAGKGAQQDVLKAVVEITRLHEEQTMRVERAAMAESKLDTLMGRDPSTPIGPLPDPPDVGALPAVADLQRLAIERQPELVQARAEIARAESAVKSIGVERKPDFVVTGGYMRMPEEHDAFTAGIGITWPNAPWTKQRNDIAEQQARLDVAAARARYDAAVNTLRLMVQEAYIKLISARDRAALLRTSLVPQTNQALDLSRIGYQADRAPFLEIIDNQRMLAGARLGYYQALADLEQARADVERAVGASLVSAGQE